MDSFFLNQILDFLIITIFQIYCFPAIWWLNQIEMSKLTVAQMYYLFCD